MTPRAPYPFLLQDHVDILSEKLNKMGQETEQPKERKRNELWEIILTSPNSIVPGPRRVASHSTVMDNIK